MNRLHQLERLREHERDFHDLLKELEHAYERIGKLEEQLKDTKLEMQALEHESARSR